MLLLLASLAHASTCTYAPTAWSHAEATAVPLPRVVKDRAALTAEERGPRGCTPCSEDQVERALANGVRFTACAAVADALVAALDRALAEGAVIEAVSGYRPVRSAGPLDAEGRRTELSAHAYGLAIDINPEHNGLYAECTAFSESCRLVRGGPWRPGEEPRSIAPDSPLVAALARLGWAWGGELEGAQKDYMHFAPP